MYLNLLLFAILHLFQRSWAVAVSNKHCPRSFPSRSFCFLGSALLGCSVSQQTIHNCGGEHGWLCPNTIDGKFIQIAWGSFIHSLLWDSPLPLSQCNVLIWWYWWTDFQFLQTNFSKQSSKCLRRGRSCFGRGWSEANSAFSYSLSIQYAVGTMVWEYWVWEPGSRFLNRDFWTDKIKFQTERSGKQYFVVSCVQYRLKTLKVALNVRHLNWNVPSSSWAT